MNTSIEPYVRYIAKSNYSLANKLVYTNDCRLFYILSGSGSFETPSKAYTLIAGTLIYYPCGLPYKISSDEGNNLIFYTVNFDFSHKYSHVPPMAPISVSERSPNEPLYTQEETETDAFDGAICLQAATWCENPLNVIYEEMLKKSEGGEAIRSALMKVILINTFRKRQSMQTDSICQTVKDLLHQNVHVNNLRIAEMLNYHPYYLNTVFKRDEGVSLHQYIIRQRLAKAYHLIASTQMSFSEISAACGFSSQSHMSTAFKKHFSVSPSQIRQLL